MPTSVPEDYLGQWRYLRRGVQTSSHIVLENGVLLEVDTEGAVEANSKTAMQYNKETGHLTVDYGENDSEWEGQLSPDKVSLVWEQVRGPHLGRVREWTRHLPA